MWFILALSALGSPVWAQVPVVPPVSVGAYVTGNTSRNYSYLAEGFSFELGSDRDLAVLMRGMGYHAMSRASTNNPADPDEVKNSDLHFGRLQAGLRYQNSKSLRVEFLGGRDGFGSRAHTVDGGVSWWPLMASYHPVQLSMNSGFNDGTRIVSGTAGASVGLGRLKGALWFLTGFGELYGGGAVKRPLGRMGAGVRVSHWERSGGIEVSGGGGANGPFIQLTFFQPFSF